jgi:hypothetical protein
MTAISRDALRKLTILVVDAKLAEAGLNGTKGNYILHSPIMEVT